MWSRVRRFKAGRKTNRLMNKGPDTCGTERVPAFKKMLNDSIPLGRSVAFHAEAFGFFCCPAEGLCPQVLAGCCHVPADRVNAERLNVVESLREASTRFPDAPPEEAQPAYGVRLVLKVGKTSRSVGVS